jgi:hypothetical protein
VRDLIEDSVPDGLTDPLGGHVHPKKTLNPTPSLFGPKVSTSILPPFRPRRRERISIRQENEAGDLIPVVIVVGLQLELRLVIEGRRLLRPRHAPRIAQNAPRSIGESPHDREQAAPYDPSKAAGRVGDTTQILHSHRIRHRARCRKRKKIKWSRRGSNPRPLECDSSALPAELRPHTMRRTARNKNVGYSQGSPTGQLARATTTCVSDKP